MIKTCSYRSYERKKINSYDYTSLGAGEIYSVSQSISYGLGTVEICLTITNTGEKYQDIKILGGVDKNFFRKSKPIDQVLFWSLRIQRGNLLFMIAKTM